MTDNFIKELIDVHTSFVFPDRDASRDFLLAALGLLFPHFSQNTNRDETILKSEISILKTKLLLLLHPLKLDRDAQDICQEFFSNLQDVRKTLLLDAQAMYEGDPAATSVDEVILAYPGFFAIAIHRIAHILHELKVPILPRMFSEYAHQSTGVDIHPAAQIGKRFCIDHATGIVVGETTVIGENVKIYQGVTLGALSVSKDLAKKKRHPTIEDDVVIYANATILGGETVIGRGTVVGGNVWIVSSIPANSMVYHSSDVKVRVDEKK